jgi:glycosyltransferase involved in cell wall biosynthesis
LILVTTSDYFPKLGGLSSFTENIVKVLKESALPFDLFHWKKYQDIQDYSHDELAKYSLIINIHPQFAWLSDSHHGKMINFVHGSEILMRSPNPVKHIFKRVQRKKYFSKIENCFLNIFISEATHLKAVVEGFKTDYSRDLILHNCIDTNSSQFIKKDITGKLVFSCIVRNVPHKNLLGSVNFCEIVSDLTGQQVELLVPKNSQVTSDKIKIIELKSADDNERDNAYKAAHFNLLLSLDHSSRGFFEGFGLTVLEAAKFGTPSIVMNTGGLPEAVHQGETGWVIEEVSVDSVKTVLSKFDEVNYQKMAIECFKHTTHSHSLNEYSRLFEAIYTQRGVA